MSAESPHTRLPHSAWVPLAAGPLNLAFCPDTAWIRHIRFGSIEVLRGIYAAVRDRNWGTVATTLSNLRIDRAKDAFRITFTAHCQRSDIAFEWEGTVEGASDGVIQFTFDGRAISMFERNRIGCCVLHPIRECAGTSCTIETVDGSLHPGCFPDDISPHQPFKNMRSITHDVMPGLRARVELEGDVFEMEDQRNWSDASFKTYCTPLELPFPVRIMQGTQIRQRVTLRLESQSATLAGVESRREAADPIRLRPGPVVSLPRLGLCVSGDATPLASIAQARLRALRPDHLRVDLRFDQGSWSDYLQRAAGQAAQLGAPLHVALHLGDNARPELSQLQHVLDAVRAPVSAWLVFHRTQKCASADWLSRVAPLLRAMRPHAAVVSGTDAYFTELNRGRPPHDVADRICFSINPQVHAFDDVSLAETLETQTHIIRCAIRLTHGVPIVVSPVSLRPRFSPSATGPEVPPPPGELPPQVDPRQCSLFAAGWTLGSVAALAAGGAFSVTLYETIGWRGVMEHDAGCPLPEKFPSVPGSVFPLYHVLADLAELIDRPVRVLESANPLYVQGLATADASPVFLVANLTDQPQWIALPIDAAGGPWVVRVLDDQHVPAALTEPEPFRSAPGRAFSPPTLELGPHAYARIEPAGKSLQDSQR